MRRLKLKLGFNKETSVEERKSKLNLWLSVLLRGRKMDVVEEEHYDTMSYVVAMSCSEE